MALKNFTQFTPQTVLSATDFVVGYRALDEIRTDLSSLTDAISGLLITKGFTPGGSLGSVRRISYRYTIGSGSPLNAVSGIDDFGRTLSYTPSQIEVYRNGAHLIESLDFLATNSTQVTNLSTLNVGDIVEVVALSATGVTVNQTLTGSGVIIQSNYRYTVPTSLANGAVVVTGTDDFGSTLRYLPPNLDVYLNGSHLVNSYDYSATDGINITLGQALANGDVVDVQTLSSAGTNAIYGLSAFSGVTRILAGSGIYVNPPIGTGVVTISADGSGFTSLIIPVRSSNPSPLVEGGVWVNSTVQKLYISITATAWALGPNSLWVTAYGNLAGTTTSAVLAGGANSENSIPQGGGNYPVSSRSYNFNGTAWSTTGTVIPIGSDGYYLGYTGGSAGTQTAALFWNTGTGCTQTTNTFSYNGTTWSNVAATANARRYVCHGCGTQSAALNAGGNNNITYYSEATKWNGSAWSSTGSMSIARTSGFMFGTQNDALVGGTGTGTTAATTAEAFNGTSWASTGSLLVQADTAYSCAGNSSTSGIYYGAVEYAFTYSRSTFEWNGTTWSQKGNMILGGLGNGGCGSTNSALAQGGQAGGATQIYSSGLQALQIG